VLRRILLFICCVTIAIVAAATDSDTPDTPEQVVHRFVAAFNAHDTDAMLGMVQETGSKEQLREAMADYFKSCTSCQSRLAHIFSSGSRVSTLEIASYDTKNGPQEQQSVAVYEFSGSLITRVYYFPAE